MAEQSLDLHCSPWLTAPAAEATAGRETEAPPLMPIPDRSGQPPSLVPGFGGRGHCARCIIPGYLMRSRGRGANFPLLLVAPCGAFPVFYFWAWHVGGHLQRRSKPSGVLVYGPSVLAKQCRILLGPVAVEGKTFSVSFSH